MKLSQLPATQTTHPPTQQAPHRTAPHRILSRRRLSTVLIVILMSFSFALGNVTGFLARPALAQDSRPTEFSIFWEAWDLVVTYFVDQDKIDFQTMTYGAIQGMLDSLGDENHTVFFSPEVAEQQESALEGSFEGIGAYVSLEDDGQFMIVAPIHGSPAEEAGILAGDIVLAVNGNEITGMEEWEVISLIRGPSGTIVTLTVLHPEVAETEEIEITRGRIDIESVLWGRIPGTNLAHIQVTQFASDTSQELQQILREIQANSNEHSAVEGIILDLRNNPGGYLQEALRVGSHFLPEGEVILHERDAQDNTTTYRSQGTGLARTIPMVVLVNPGSASAAEILAGALQENGRAKIIGEATIGTGTVLRPFRLSDGSVVRLGVTNWLTPDYKLIKGQGIQPDIKIEQNTSVEMLSSQALPGMSEREVRVHPDRQFQAALLLLHLQIEPEQPATTSAPPSNAVPSNAAP